MRHLVILCAMFWGAIPQSSIATEILLTGAFHGSDVDVPSTEGWLALVEEEGTFHLKAVDLKLGQVKKKKPKHTEHILGKTIQISDTMANAILLIKAPSLKEGQVDGQLLSRNRFIHPGEMISVTVKERASFIVASGTAESTEVATDFRFKNYQLSLVLNGQNPIKLASFPTLSDGRPTITWVGDLNKDGILDVIADMTTQYDVERPTLYLSQPGKKPVHQVAQLRLKPY